jgi:hypothetical protein
LVSNLKAGVNLAKPTKIFNVTVPFSNKPQNRCQDFKVEDPLLEPQKISGGFNRFTEEATKDRYGYPILNSAHEQVRGPQVEFDNNRPVVKIEQNVANLQLDLLTVMIDTVNGYYLWGFPPRSIKLSGVSWERKFYGNCSVYYTRQLEFELAGLQDAGLTGTGSDPEPIQSVYKTWDRELLDEGTKVLKGHWKRNGNWVLDKIDGAYPDPSNPTHFIRFKDRNGENTRVILNGAGLPAGVRVGSGSGSISDETEIGSIYLEKYHESDFLLLGIPTSF